MELIWRRFGQAEVDIFASLETSHCPLWLSLTHPALEAYVHSSCPMRKSDQMLVCLGSPKKGCPPSKQTISKWIVEVISIVYEVCSMPLPLLIRAHYEECGILEGSIVGGLPSRGP